VRFPWRGVAPRPWHGEGASMTATTQHVFEFESRSCACRPATTRRSQRRVVVKGPLVVRDAEDEDFGSRRLRPQRLAQRRIVAEARGGALSRHTKQSETRHGHQRRRGRSHSTCVDEVVEEELARE
jgi:hypothetical protein